MELTEEKKQQMKTYIQTHRDKWNDYQREYRDRTDASYKRRKKIVKRKLWAIEYKGNKCSICNKQYPPYIYEFHHLIGKTNKRMNFIGNFALLKAELDKTILVCANCHLSLHYSKKKWDF